MLQPMLLALVSFASLGDTAVVDYYGPHPLPDSIDHAMCWIEGPHFHSYEPEDRVLYVEDDDHWVFVGDPTEYERASPSHVYYGHHPVTWVAVHEAEPAHYCYITGPHHHWHAPPPTTVWVEKGGAWWYTGAHPRWYESRRAKHKHVDAHYAKADVIVRPAVVYAPPAGWVGVTFGGKGVTASIGVGFGAPAPVVVHHHPAPVVIIEEHHHHGKHHKHHGHHGHGRGHGHHKHKGKKH